MHLPLLHNFQRRAVNNRNKKKKQYGDRSQIFGTRRFDSGYDADRKPGTSEHPFIFWPISWPGTVGGGSANAAYLNVEDKYGNATNPDRVGGPMMIATFSSGSTNFTIVSDDFTVRRLAEAIASSCMFFLSEPFISNSTENIEAYSGSPLPESVVQYYRSSSIALTSDGYINNATYSAPGAPEAGLPDFPGLQCFNQTIGSKAPLFVEFPSRTIWTANTEEERSHYGR
ncbi:hypothetical protein CVT25_010554 [Psilocybe cyanescens]|uniref:Uncharacterized protein n=1 Tax=Psilocybe cyanescens TaxID=93625 RepID=A0A409WJG2_PSICY|nr:hypothetical protein CVT25_010554 [Psilocybe cyanescens]